MKVSSMLLTLSLLAVSQSGMAMNATDPSINSCTDEHCEAQMRDLKRFAKWGEPSANFVLAFAYLEGQGVEQDAERAYKLFKRSARKGTLEAMYQVALMTYNGIGTEVDQEKGIELLERAKNRGHDLAQVDFAVHLLTKNDAVQADYDEAVSLLESAARRGNVRANYLLGKLYMDDQYVAADLEKAMDHLYFASTRNYKDSYELHAQLYDNAKAEFPLERIQAPVGEMEVIQVTSSRLEFVDLLDYVLKRAHQFGRYDGKTTGTRLNGYSCAEVGICTTVEGRNHVDIFLLRNVRGM